MCFYKLKARPFTSKKITTRFIIILVSFGGLELSPWYLCGMPVLSFIDITVLSDIISVVFYISLYCVRDVFFFLSHSLFLTLELWKILGRVVSLHFRFLFYDNGNISTVCLLVFTRAAAENHSAFLVSCGSCLMVGRKGPSTYHVVIMHQKVPICDEKWGCLSCL